MLAGEGVQVFMLLDSVLTEMLTVKQSAYHLKYSIRTIQQWIGEGKLIAINVDNRNWIPRSEIDRIHARDNATQNVAS
jgi:predicted site-specific integrase-resolvase